MLLLIVGVKEPEPATIAKRVNPISWESLQQLSPAYRWVVAIGAVFTLARFSEAFLVLRAMQGGMKPALIPLVMVAMNLVYMLSAYPFGKLADSMSHRSLLVSGLGFLIVADVILAQSGHWSFVLCGVALWGLHMGATQGLLAAMVTHTAPPALRGTSFGFFNLVSGIAMLLASVIAGLLWDHFSAKTTFYSVATFCIVAIIMIIRRGGAALSSTK